MVADKPIRGRYPVGMLGLGTFAGVVKELRRDVASARDRDPAARGVGPVEIVATWPGIHALLSHRVAHALHESGVLAAAADARDAHADGDGDLEYTPRRRSAGACSSTTARGWWWGRRRRSATT